MVTVAQRTKIAAPLVIRVVHSTRAHLSAVAASEGVSRTPSQRATDYRVKVASGVTDRQEALINVVQATAAEGNGAAGVVVVAVAVTTRTAAASGHVDFGM